MYSRFCSNEYTHAVLVPKTASVSAEAMLASLKTMGLKDKEEANRSIIYDWNTNGKDGSKLDDVQAAYDFKTLASANSAWQWTPTDELLLKADVMNLADDSTAVYESGSYTKARDGYLSDADVNAFMYLHAKLGTNNAQA